MNVLIIEDEIKTAKELKRLLEGLDDTITVLDILPSVKSAIQWFTDHPSPDLVFSDIQLADGLSFDIYRNVSVQAPVIFCTAFDEYAIQAFQANSIDYLLKPIDEDKLTQSLEKYKRLKGFFDLLLLTIPPTSRTWPDSWIIPSSGPYWSTCGKRSYR